VHSLEDEVRELARGAAPTTPVAMALETGEAFSVRTELLIVLYGAIAAVIGGVGLMIRAHLDRIGPVALTVLLFAAAALCHGLALRPRIAGRERSLWLDYVLLLGTLLTSSAVGYAEFQFHWFGAGWSRHLLILAAWHGLMAYFYGSRLVLSVALTAFAAWLGVEWRPAALIDGRTPLVDLGWRAIGCAVLYAVGAVLHARGARPAAFRDVYEQFAANLALAGALVLGFSERWLWAGVTLLAAFAIALIRQGLARRQESLVLWAVAYATLGAVGLEARVLGSVVLASNVGLLTVVGAVVLMLRLRARLKRADA
jgi:hypothetical protein